MRGLDGRVRPSDYLTAGNFYIVDRGRFFEHHQPLGTFYPLGLVLALKRWTVLRPWLRSIWAGNMTRP